MDKPRSLDALLKSHDIPAEEFFQTLGIAQQIRNNLTRFIRYCRSHRTFARRMITLALNVPASDLEQDPALRTASHAITEVLSNEEPALAELFFEEQPTPTPEGSDIPEEL
uniref:Predicted protein n=1 Tax=Hordeum vulgare subsp. vulgare TaxID=112509 RepID=F2DUZ6_HORVV|nr:predicted protein [Hordeum vulgare subsp. vulgare]